MTPTLAYRYTAYDLEQGLADQVRRQALFDAGIDPTTATPDQLRGNTSPSRSLPVASLDAGMFFDRETTIGGKSFLHTLEPRLFYLRTPYRDQSELPIFDTRDFTFSWGQLFRDSRYTGADRQNDANQLTMALSTRFIDQTTGRERFSGSIGQILYFDDSRVTLPGQQARSSRASRRGSPMPITPSTTAGRSGPPTSGIPSTSGRTWPACGRGI